jgi:hypothetical protein
MVLEKAHSLPRRCFTTLGHPETDASRRNQTPEAKKKRKARKGISQITVQTSTRMLKAVHDVMRGMSFHLPRNGWIIPPRGLITLLVLQCNALEPLRPIIPPIAGKTWIPGPSSMGMEGIVVIW